MMFNSQHEIEKYVNHFFQEPGFFLEIGCWDGELISQTAWLEREKGWTGLCVDPFPMHFNNRSCRICAKAVSGSMFHVPGGTREFIKVGKDRRYGGNVSYFSGFKDSVKAHWELIEKYCDYQIVQVPTITVEEMYQEYQLPDYIEFLSVDTEGSELEIFESIDFSVHRFGLIVFEHNEDAEVKRRIGELLMEHGYVRIAEMRCDDVYLNGSLI